MDGFSLCENGQVLKDALEVLIADGNSDSYVDCPGTYDYIVQLKKAYEGCFDFTPCWGKITVEDKSGPKIVSAIFAPDSILCKDVNLILNNPKSIGLPGADFRSPRQNERTFGARNINMGSNGAYNFSNLTKGSDYTVSPQLDKYHFHPYL